MACSIVLGAVSFAQAQDASYFSVTAAANCRVEAGPDAGEAWLDAVGDPIPYGTIKLIGPEARLMATNLAGHVVIVGGPAMFELHPTNAVGEQSETFRIRDGSFQFVTGDPPNGREKDDVTVEVLKVGSDDLLCGLTPENGTTYVRSAGSSTEVAFSSSTGASLRIAGLEQGLASGQMAAWAGGAAPQVGSASEWLGRNVDSQIVAQLGEASALAARSTVADSLFKKISQWDQYGDVVVAQPISTARFTPEFRAVSFSVGSVIRPISATGARQATTPFFGANEVPPLSPAALAVANIIDGQTAIDLNRDARALITQTGSQGLGFGGLRQLAIPGIFGGIRTLGPAGLGVEKARR